MTGSLNLAIFLFHAVFVVITLVNFPFGKYFIGWDALNPELNFFLNFKRVFSAFWQENYGLGLLGGHGFAATLPHTIITFLFSLVLPFTAIRPSFTFLCLYLGGLGMYFLSKLILNESFSYESHASRHSGHSAVSSGQSNCFVQNPDSGVSRLRRDPQNDNCEIRVSKRSHLKHIIPYVALVTSFFYMFNLATLQMFYVQLEAFTVQFASLPWLFWSAIKVIENAKKKNIAIFLLINFFAATQGFIPSLFVAYIISLLIFLFVLKTSIKKVVLILVLTFIVNAYWLLPLFYYQATKNNIFLNSYNNLTSTPHFIDINKKYGSLENIILLKSFLFDAFELNGYVLEPWIKHYQNLLVSIVSYFFFLVSLFGLLSNLFLKNKLIKSFAFVYLFFFISIATNLPPFSYITKLLQALSPIYEQAFRASFTKFSIGFAFSYSIFFGVGIIILFRIIRHFKKIKFPIVFIVLLIMLAFYSLPTFTGHFLYNKLMLKIPPAYFDVIDYFKDKEDGRIADFPQDCPEGWYAYKWGYFGSGFYWYGIKQPFLARTFDVWSNYNENYYWEITQALREQKFEKIDALMQKYQVKWILYDPNLAYCKDQKGIFTHQALIEYIEKSPQYKLVKTFIGQNILPIKLYKNYKDQTQSFITVKNNLKNIGPEYLWNDNDLIYYELGDYITKDTENFSSYIPFRSLFTKRRSQEDNVKIEENKNGIDFQTKIPKHASSYMLTSKSIINLEKSIPVKLYINTLNGESAFYASLQFPQIYLDNAPIVDFSNEILLGKFMAEDLKKLTLLLNGEKLTFKKQSENEYQAVFYFNLNNTVEVYKDNENLLSWQSQKDPFYQGIINQGFSAPLPAFKQGILRVTVPKIDNQYYAVENALPIDNTTPTPCNLNNTSGQNKYDVGTEDKQEYLRLFAQNNSQCVFADISDISTSFGYLLKIKTRKITGGNLKFSLVSEAKTVYNDQYVYGSKDFNSFYYIIPPTFPNGIGYEMRFENSSESNTATINDLAGMSVWNIPYAFVKNLRLTQKIEDAKAFSTVKNATTQINHPIETLYSVTLNNETIEQPASPQGWSNNPTIVLSQSFDPGWKAYKAKNYELGIMNYAQLIFPFFFGSEIKEHVLVNNWANGWNLDSSKFKVQSSKFVIVYLPQYLQYFGFLLLIGTFGFLIKYKKI